MTKWFFSAYNEYQFTGGEVEHKFGVEVKENRQFHHTKTSPDGVRLGCYGYEIFGEKLSTSYVTDLQGYRIVKSQRPIPVYPRDGSGRQASFVGEFNEPEDLSENIRYFLPNGCQ
jgi:hypothetical protein